MAMEPNNLTEDGIPAGTWNKYQSRNPIQRYLVNRFLKTLTDIVKPYASGDQTAIDVGCGEGVTTRLLKNAGFTRIVGYDFSEGILKEARACSPGIPFVQKNIYEIGKEERSDFVSACEVLEHLDNPELGLERIAMSCRKTALFSVPNALLFRSLNFCAGKYMRDFGNSPGHLNHWNARSFVRFIESRFDVAAVATPLPWTIVVARPK